MAVQISHGLSCTLKGKVCYHPTKAIHDDILSLTEYPNLEGIHKDDCSPAPTLYSFNLAAYKNEAALDLTQNKP